MWVKRVSAIKYHNVICTNWESVVKTILPDAAFWAYCLGSRCYTWSYRRLCSYYFYLFFILPLTSFVSPYCDNWYTFILLICISIGCVYQLSLKALLAYIAMDGRIDNYRWVSLLRSNCVCKIIRFFDTLNPVRKILRNPWSFFFFWKIRKEVRSLKSFRLRKLGGIMK